jgi:phosphonate transport system substrate-binding protein
MKKWTFLTLLLVFTLALLASASVALAAPPAQGAEQDYTVQADDNLWNLADKYFGNGAAYPAIVIATNTKALDDTTYSRIVNPSIIIPGQKLRIPTATDAEAYLTPPKAGELGSKDKPIELYFVPSVDANVIVTSGQAIADYILKTTGTYVDVKVPTSYAAVIEAMGVAKGDTFAFIPALGYVLAHDKFGVDVALAVVRFGRSYYATEFLVRADSGITSIKDLNGKKWAMPSLTSTSGYLYPKSLLIADGVTPSEEVVAGGHPQAVLAVYQGSADFGTAFYSPPGELEDWNWGDPPEPSGQFHIEKDSQGRNQPFIGDLQIRDARASVIDTAPDVIEKVKILTLSERIPNDTVSFVKDFPPTLRFKIVNALLNYADSAEGQAVLQNPQFYDISGFDRVDDTFYDPVRNLIKNIGLTEADILK